MSLAEPPLDEAEERAWRAFARALLTVPRALDADLRREQGLSMAEYFVLVNLSETPDRALRISELASSGSLSASRMSRVVDALAAAGHVQRARCESDGRVQIVTLTDAGLQRLATAYPAHLRSVRVNVVDHLQGLDLDAFATAVSRFAPGCPTDATPPTTSVPRRETSS